VVSLIASISLYDATLVAGAGELALVLLALVEFVLIFALQRFIAGA